MELFEPDDHGLKRYPWHEAQWEALMRDPMRHPHALLLSGPPGLGKHAFATRLAWALLCAAPDDGGEPCGGCRNCQLLDAGTHPDLTLVEPTEDGKAITVDQVRALVDFATRRPHTAARKVVIMVPAEAMNLNAANSLLKLLEEPPLGNFFILVTAEPAKLPATIRSRCHRISLRRPPREQAIAWLNAETDVAADAVALLDVASGAPLQALALARDDFGVKRTELLDDMEAMRSQETDPVSCAARWHQLGTGLCLGWLQGLVSDLIKMVFLGGEAAYLTNVDLAPRLQRLAHGLNLKRLYRFADAVADARALVTSPVDDLLLLEDILIRWRKVSEQ